MSEFVVESFVNDIGQTVNPGDDVIYVGTSSTFTEVRRGKFAGVYYQKHSWNLNAPAVICAVKVDNVPDRVYWYDPETKTGVHYNVLRTAYLPLKRVYKIA